MLGDRHQLQVRVAHLVAVFDQHVSQFAITEIQPVRLGRLPPTSEMHFINRKRLLEPIGRFTLLAPISVVPLEVTEVVNNRRGLGTHLAEEGIGVGLLQHLSVRRADSEFIGRTVADARHEAGPHAAVAPIQPKVAVLPTGLVAQDADLAGAGCPDGEARSINAVDPI